MFLFFDPRHCILIHSETKTQVNAAMAIMEIGQHALPNVMAGLSTEEENVQTMILVTLAVIVKGVIQNLDSVILRNVQHRVGCWNYRFVKKNV